MKRLSWLLLFLLLPLLVGVQTASAQNARLNDAKLSPTKLAVAQTDDDDAWHAAYDPIVTNLINLDDQIRTMEVKINEIGKMTDRKSQLLAIRDFEKSVLDKEAEALKIGLDVIGKSDSFLPTADLTNETRQKIILIIHVKITLIITRIIQIKGTIILILERRPPPFIPGPPVLAGTTTPISPKQSVSRQ